MEKEENERNPRPNWETLVGKPWKMFHSMEKTMLSIPKQ
jgi:hypothetical protein